ADLLDSVRGRCEWGIRVVADRDVLTRQLAPSAKAATSGGDYLRRRRAELQAVGEVDDLGARIADELHSCLAAAAERSAVLQPRQPDPRLLLSTAYLVPFTGQEHFLARVSELQDAHAGVTVEVTGPWPAYSFTQADVGG